MYGPILYLANLHSAYIFLKPFLKTVVSKKKII